MTTPFRATHPAVVVAVLAAMLAGCVGGASPDTDDEPPLATPSAASEHGPSPTPSPSPAPTPTPRRSPSPSPTTAAAPPDPATVHDDPAELTDTLVAAERRIRDAATPADALRGWAWAQQAAYRQLAATTGWHDDVVAAVPPDLTAVVERNLQATVELRALTAPREELPDGWRIVAPPPPEELLAHYREAADEFGIDWTYLAAIHLVESRMGRIRGDSVAGARGPMQFLPSTWEAYGRGDIEDYGDAIRAAAFYLADHGAPEDMPAALWAYNHSDHYVRAIEHHAAVMRADERAYLAYYHWRVYYRLVSGDVVLPEGWRSE